MAVSGTEIERLARRYMWVGHGCESRYLYGDDGEMQCHHCGLDFKRGDLEWLDKRVQECLFFAAARKSCHYMGFPWIDPRTGIQYDPPALAAIIRRLQAPPHETTLGVHDATQKSGGGP